MTHPCVCVWVCGCLRAHVCVCAPSPLLAAVDPQLSGEAEERFGGRVGSKFTFLSAAERRDGRRRRPDDPNFDPTTVFVPESFLRTLTGGQVTNAAAYSRRVRDVCWSKRSREEESSPTA